MGSLPNSEIVLVKNTSHPDAVKNYMKAGLNETIARQQVYKDLRTGRLERDIKNKNQKLDEASKMVEKYQALSMIDTLTGLPNRRALDGDPNLNPPYTGELTRIFSHAKRYSEPVTALMLDIDFFKRINDTYGHKIGDEVLRVVGKTILENIRSGDFACRYGGEEFIILLPETNHEEAINLAERLRQKVAKSAELGRYPVTVSIGAADYPNFHHPEVADSAALVHAADECLYKAKEEGRNRIVSINGTRPKAYPINPT